MDKIKEKEKVNEQYVKANKSIIECFDGAQERKKKALDKTSEIQLQLEKRKNQICGGLLEIQGKASIIVNRLRTSLGDSKLSTGKMNDVKNLIESVKKSNDQPKDGYVSLYEEVEKWLKPQTDNVENEIHEVMENVRVWYSNMDTLTEEMDCDLISKKELRGMKTKLENLSNDNSAQKKDIENLTKEISKEIKNGENLAKEVLEEKKKGENLAKEVIKEKSNGEALASKVSTQKKDIENLTKEMSSQKTTMEEDIKSWKKKAEECSSNFFERKELYL